MIKKKRMTSKTALEIMRLFPCMACQSRQVEIDHIRTRGAGGGDFIESEGKVILNVWPLCHACHMEKHAMGLESFLKKYPKANNYLKNINHPLALK